MLEDQTDYQSLEATSESLDVEYQRLIAYHLTRWGVPESCASVEVRQIGQDERGRDVFVGVVRLFGWERNGALRLLVGLPLFEKKIRNIVKGLWIADVSHFGGIWLQASGELQDGPAASELRRLVFTLTGPRSGHASRRPDRCDTPPIRL